MYVCMYIQYTYCFDKIEYLDLFESRVYRENIIEPYRKKDEPLGLTAHLFQSN